MAERPKGNIFYEIIIVVLIVILIGSILYPSRIWRKESNQENVCRTRMEAIQQLQLQFVVKTNTYTDSLAMLVDQIEQDPSAAAAIDSLIMWDQLVLKDNLKALVLGKEFPGELRSHILQRFEEDKPLGNLGGWDSLEYVLIEDLEEKLQNADPTSETVFDNSVNWPVLTGEDRFYEIINSDDVPRRVRSRTTIDIQRRGVPIQETPSWSYCRELFIGELQKKVEMALRTDVYTPEEEDAWEEQAEKEWVEMMNSLSQAEKDSIWKENQNRMWDKQKELIWKEDRKKLWNEEKDQWIEENETIWKRAIVQQWSQERKKEWQEQTLVTLPDSLKLFFPAQRDSLWRTVEDSIFEADYPEWREENEKYVNEVITTVWENERRVTWEDGARAEWIEQKQADWSSLWSNIVEDTWNINSTRLWREEQEKLSAKHSAIKRIDQAVVWRQILGQDRIQQVVNNLSLPDNMGVWKRIEASMGEKTAALYSLGLHRLFKSALIDSAVSGCPVAKLPYVIHVVDTLSPNQMSMACPILDSVAVREAGLEVSLPPGTDEKGYAIVDIDPAGGDTSFVDLDVPGIKKILGGASIKPHGFIDLEGKKSWEKRTR